MITKIERGKTYHVAANAQYSGSTPSPLAGRTLVALKDCEPDYEGDVYLTSEGVEDYVHPYYVTEVTEGYATRDLAAALVALGSDLDADRLLAVADAIARARA